MTFITEYSNEIFKPATMMNLLIWSKTKIFRVKFGVNELLLDEYCKAHYKTGLREVCWNILLNVKFMSDHDGKIIGKILNRDLDQIARIITYGTGKLKGSPILKNALTL